MLCERDSVCTKHDRVNDELRGGGDLPRARTSLLIVLSDVVNLLVASSSAVMRINMVVNVRLCSDLRLSFSLLLFTASCSAAGAPSAPSSTASPSLRPLQVVWMSGEFSPG